jgi:hypothetical protein
MSTQTIGAMRSVRPVNNRKCNLLQRCSLSIRISNSGRLLHKKFHNVRDGEKSSTRTKYSS